MKYILSIRHDECDPGACMFEQGDSDKSISINYPSINEYDLIDAIHAAFKDLQQRFNLPSREEIDVWCNQNYRNYLSSTNPNKIPFIKDVRNKWNIGLKEAKDAVERCEPFMRVYTAYQKYLDALNSL